MDGFCPGQPARIGAPREEAAPGRRLRGGTQLAEEVLEFEGLLSYRSYDTACSHILQNDIVICFGLDVSFKQGCKQDDYAHRFVGNTYKSTSNWKLMPAT